MKALVVMLFLSLVLAGRVGATAQIPDSIIIDGKEYALNTNPLEVYLQGRKDFIPENASRSTANWRGYVATWKISNGKLALTRMDIRLYDKVSRKHSSRNIQSTLFPNQSSVVASWYSGALIIPDGRMTNYVHMGYGSTYDHYRIYRIDKGQVIEALSLNEKEFVAYRARKFEAFKKTDQYRLALASLKNEVDAMEDPDIESFMKSYFAEDYLGR